MDASSTVDSWPVSSHTFHVQVTFLTPDLPFRFNHPLTWHDLLAVIWHGGPLDFLSFHGYVSEQQTLQFHYRAIEDHGPLATSKYVEVTFPPASDGDWWKSLHAEFDHGHVFLFDPEDRNATWRKLWLCASSGGNGERTGALPYTPLHAFDMKLPDEVSDAVTTIPAVELPLSLSRESSPVKRCPPTFTPYQTSTTTKRPLYQHRRSESAGYSSGRIFKIDVSTTDPSRKLTFTRTALSTIEETPKDIRSDMPLSDSAATVVKPKHDMSATPLEHALRGWQGLIEEMQKGLATLPRARKGNYENLKARALRGVAADMSLISTTMWRLRENVETEMAEVAKAAAKDNEEAQKEAQDATSGGKRVPETGAEHVHVNDQKAETEQTTPTKQVTLLRSV